MDWASRHVLAWRLSNTLDAGFCVEALDDALARHGPPEIFNTDQGSQFTSGAFTGHLQAAGIQISMDGLGRCMDNIFIERLWRSLKYEAVYLHELADGLKARRVIGEWIGFYTTERPHSALGGRTPAEAYRGARPVDMIPTGSRTPADTWRSAPCPHPHRQQNTGTATRAQGTRQRDALRVLRQSPVAHLTVPEAPLHIQERMLHLRPHRCLALLGRRLGAVPIEQATLARLHRHLPGDAATPVLRALVHTLVGGMINNRNTP